MNELIPKIDTDFSMFEGCPHDYCSGNQSVKRLSDVDQTIDMKRVREEDNETLSSQPLVYNLNDSRLIDNNEEEEEYREYTEEEQGFMNLTNLLVNIRLNLKAIDWDDIYVDNSNDKELSLKRTKQEVEFPLKEGEVNHGYFLEKLVSATKRTAIYLGYRVKKPERQVVIKIGFEMGFHGIENECNIYMDLKKSESVPQLIDYMWWKTYPEEYTSIQWGFIVLEKCGPNLVDLMKRSALGVIESMEEVYEIAIRLIDAIEGMHEKGFVHLSLKPEHILISEDKSLIKLISLSASKTYLKKRVNGKQEHIEDQKDRRLPKGDPNFHSIGYHNGFRRSRRDDMESLGYCLIYVVKGSLPWMDRSNVNLTSAKVIRKIGNKMQNTSLIDLCDGVSPAFRQYFDLISKYQFNYKPDYEELRNCFRVNTQ